MSSNDDADFLGGSYAPAAKFATIGDIVRGTIISIEKRQQTDPATLKPKFWDDGNPMIQHFFTLQTDERDSSIEDDDGQRRIFVKGSAKPESKSLNAAVKAAMQKAGAKPGALVGGKLAVKYTGDGPKVGALSAPKQYAATFENPVAFPVEDDEEPF